MSHKKYRGVGVNLRLECIDEALENPPEVDLLEIIADNWLSEGPHHKKLTQLRKDYAISFHCVGMNLGGTDPLNQDYLKKIKKLKQKFDPIHVSDHLCFQFFQGVHHHDLLPFPLNDSYLRNVEERVGYIQDFLEEPILLENLSYYIEYKESQYFEHEFLNKLHKSTGCLFLLDINNIWVNGKNLSISPDHFLDNIHWEAVRETHTAGAEKFNNIYVDTHGEKPHEEVLQIIAKYRDKLLSTPLIYERDQNIDSLSQVLEQLNPIKEILCG